MISRRSERDIAPYLQIATGLRALAAAASSADVRAEFAALAAQYERLGQAVSAAANPRPAPPRAAAAAGSRRHV